MLIMPPVVLHIVMMLVLILAASAEVPVYRFHVVIGIRHFSRGGGAGRHAPGVGSLPTTTAATHFPTDKSRDFGQKGAHVGKVPEHDWDP